VWRRAIFWQPLYKFLTPPSLRSGGILARGPDQKISPKNPHFSNFFLSGKKNIIGWVKKIPGSKAGQHLIYCGSKLFSGWVRSGPISKK